MHFDLLATPATWEVLSKTGKAYFDALVEHLCNITGVAVAFVVESVDPKGERVCPLSIRGVENFRDGRCYDTLGTPCERLRKGGASLFPDRLTEHFPKDSWLATTGMQSYVGLPLLDERRPISRCTWSRCTSVNLSTAPSDEATDGESDDLGGRPSVMIRSRPRPRLAPNWKSTSSGVQIRRGSICTLRVTTRM